MDFYELELDQGDPVNITAFQLDLQASPCEICEKILAIEKYIPVNKMVRQIRFWEARLEEGFLNIYVCRFNEGISRVHIFGNLKGNELNTIIQGQKCNLREFDLVTQRIKFILSRSKVILKTYYKDSKIRSIDYHLITFLSGVK